ncbi:MAG: TetR family transcriptional regulator [Solirubrobacteraceae bacterium MAG38_C4-C5]|nr:TetR family transcriptional regulator [Candidatus Siliceabacter maunaloa]
MPRPRLHNADLLLDAALGLAGAGGPAAVTMSAVARTTGAPSGSLYHLFGSQPGLAGALWVRTEERFQEGWLAALDRGDIPTAARHVVSYVRRHRDAGRVLAYGPDDFGRLSWPATLQAAHEASSARVRAALHQVGGDPERLALVTIDIPGALVRRHLLADTPIPAGAEADVTAAADALLAAAA